MSCLRLWLLAVLPAISVFSISFAADHPEPERRGQDPCGDLLVVLSSDSCAEAKELLEHAVGGPAGVKYRKLDQANVVPPLSAWEGVERFVARKDGEAVGTYSILEKTAILGGRRVKAYYGTNLTVDPAHVGRGYGKAVLGEAMKISRGRTGGEGRLDYTYVEPSKAALWHTLTSLGYESIGKYRVLVVNRVITKADSRAEKLPEAEREKMVALLSDAYQDHALTDFQFSVLPEYYYMIRDLHGEIAAGIQCSPQHWYVEHLGGVGGWFALRVIPHLPVIGAQVTRDLKFLRFGNVYVREGHEGDLNTLMSHVLNRYGLHTGTIYLDPRSAQYGVLKKNGLGFLSRLIGEYEGHVMVHAPGLDRSMREDLITGPIHISLADN